MWLKWLKANPISSMYHYCLIAIPMETVENPPLESYLYDLLQNINVQ